MTKQRFMDLSMFVCKSCGNTFPIMRSHGAQREKGHVKDIWCPYCKDDRKFHEIRHKDYFESQDGERIYM